MTLQVCRGPPKIFPFRNVNFFWKSWYNSVTFCSSYVKQIIDFPYTDPHRGGYFSSYHIAALMFFYFSVWTGFAAHIPWVLEAPNLHSKNVFQIRSYPETRRTERPDNRTQERRQYVSGGLHGPQFQSWVIFISYILNWSSLESHRKCFVSFR